MPKKRELIDWRGVWKIEYTSAWRKAMAVDIKNGLFSYHITKSKYVVDDIVTELICQEIPFKVTNLGSGFKKIYTLDNVCKHCKGKGVLK